MAKKAIPAAEIEPPQTDPGLMISPQNREAEEAVIGSILRHPKRFLEAAAILKPSDFFIHENGLIWHAFENLTSQETPIDFLTIEQELQKMGRLEETGGAPYLRRLEDDCPLGLHIPTYAQMVKTKAWRRDLIALANEIATQAFSPDKTDEEITNYMLEGTQKALGSPQGRYLVRSGIDALAPRPPINYLVEGLIYEKSITVIYGDGGTKKTWSSMYLAACVASGCPWGDFETHKTKVLFIDEENGESEMATRTAFCIRGALADQNLDLRYISLAAFHLDNPQDEALLINEILAQGAGLVIFDALADLMLGDENSKQDTQPVFNALRRIAEKTGAAILVIHHANKQNGFRGSSVIKDILIKVESEEDSHFVNFKTEKNRKGKAVKFSMYATWTEDQFSLGHSEMQEKPKTLSKSQEFVIRYLTEKGPSEINSIMGAADVCTPGAARNSVYELVKLEKIYRTNPSDSDKIHAIFDIAVLKQEIQESPLMPSAVPVYPLRERGKLKQQLPSKKTGLKQEKTANTKPEK
jgi:hypothetical protein